MRALFLPNASPFDIGEMCQQIDDRGSYGIRVSGESAEDARKLLEELHKADVVVAAGNLTVIGVWAWGYANGCRKKVVAIKGVDPCLAAKTVKFDVWLSTLPVQGDLFTRVTNVD